LERPGSEPCCAQESFVRAQMHIKKLDIPITQKRAFEQLGYRDKLRLAQLLIQLARKEEEEQNPKKRKIASASAPSDPELIQYVADRLKKMKPSKKEALLNSIGAMFQFQGGISDADKEEILSELVRRNHIIVTENNRIGYPEFNPPHIYDESAGMKP